MKKYFITVFLLVLFAVLLLWGDDIFASDFKIVPPTTNEDGTQIEFKNELGYIINCDNDSGEPYAIRVDVSHIDAGGDGIVRVPLITVLPATSGIKKWYCTAQAYYLFATDKVGRMSNEIFFVASDGASIVSVTPSPPGFGFIR